MCLGSREIIMIRSDPESPEMHFNSLKTKPIESVIGWQRWQEICFRALGENWVHDR
jgi:hypothetical protein